MYVAENLVQLAREESFAIIQMVTVALASKQAIANNPHLHVPIITIQCAAVMTKPIATNVMPIQQGSP
jgi:hypothetical protein